MKGLTIGQSASTTRSFAPEDVAAYRRLTGDVGLQFGAEAATAVPGPLLAGMVSDLLGTQLPGRGTNWLKQKISYPAVVEVGEVGTAVNHCRKLTLPIHTTVNRISIVQPGQYPVSYRLTLPLGG